MIPVKGAIDSPVSWTALLLASTDSGVTSSRSMNPFPSKSKDSSSLFVSKRIIITIPIMEM